MSLMKKKLLTPTLENSLDDPNVSVFEVKISETSYYFYHLSSSASAASVRGVGHQELQAPEPALLPPHRLQLLPGDRGEDLLPGRGEQERPRAWPLSGEDRQSSPEHGADHEDSDQV